MEDHQPQKYTCPMHPEITQDKPGNCPICGMTLVPIKSEGNDPSSHDHGKDASLTMGDIRNHDKDEPKNHTLIHNLADAPMIMGETQNHHSMEAGDINKGDQAFVKYTRRLF